MLTCISHFFDEIGKRPPTDWQYGFSITSTDLYAVSSRFYSLMYNRLFQIHLVFLYCFSVIAIFGQIRCVSGMYIAVTEDHVSVTDHNIEAKSY